MITPTGINATYLNAGQIDTKHISIMSGMTSKILIDQYGLVIKDKANKSAHITSFDADKASKDAGYAAKWGTDNNISGFMGVDSDNNAIVYTKGYLVANKGSNIAGWVTDNNSLYHLKSGTNDGTKDLWLSPNGLKSTVNNSGEKDFAIYANGKFGVTTDGTLYATGVHIEGDGTFKGTITAEAGKIAGYTIDGDTLYGSQVGMDAESGGHYAFWAGANKDNSSNAPFRVGHDGSLKATSADIEGKITATSGTIGGCSITNGTLQIKNANIDTLSVSKITGGSNSATITFSGSITCDNLSAKGTLRTGTANGVGFTVNSGGDMVYRNNVGFLVCKSFADTYHPWLSGLNVNFTNGISFRDGTTYAGAGSEIDSIRHSGNSLHITSGGNMNLSAAGSQGIGMDGDRIRLGKNSYW